MKPLIFDSTPLIYLPKIGLANLLETIPARKFIAQTVFREVVERGRSKGHADALIVANFCERGKIGVKPASNSGLLPALKGVSGLELADAEALAIAKDQGYRAIVDDLLARKVARTYRIDFAGTRTYCSLEFKATF